MKTVAQLARGTNQWNIFINILKSTNICVLKALRIIQYLIGYSRTFVIYSRISCIK